MWSKWNFKGIWLHGKMSNVCWINVRCVQSCAATISFLACFFVKNTPHVVGETNSVKSFHLNKFHHFILFIKVQISNISNKYVFCTCCFPSVKLAIGTVCIITHLASCVGQSWSDFWKRLTSYSNAEVEAVPILLSYHVTLDRSYCDQAKLCVYNTFLGSKETLQHVTKQSETIHSPMRAQLTKESVSHTLGAIFEFSGMLPSNCSLKWLLAVKFHVIPTSCKARISTEG